MPWRDTLGPRNFDLSSLPRLDERTITLRHSLDWFDGPLNGLAEYEGRACWFDFYYFDREEHPALGDPDERHYFYVLFPLSEEEAADAERRFAERDAATFDWTGPALVERRPHGWFMDGANADFYAIELVPPP